MNPNIDERIKLKFSLLWVVVMINMIFADILGFVIHFVEGGVVDVPGNVYITMLIAAVVTQIPIWMIFLSRFLEHKKNRLANIIASIFTIIYVVGGASFEYHYYFIASVEVACMLYILKCAWTWEPTET